MKLTLVLRDKKNALKLSTKSIEKFIERITTDTKDGAVARRRRQLDFGSGNGEYSVWGAAYARVLEADRAADAAWLACRTQADVEARDLDIRNAQDSLEARIPLFTLNLQTKGNEIDRNLRKGARVLALKADIDSLDASLKNMFVRGGRLQLLAQNSADILKGGKDLTSMMGILRLGSFRMRNSDGMGLTLQDNTETFRVEPATRERPTPRLTLRSKSSRLRARMDANMMGARDFSFDLTATRHIRRVPNLSRMNRRLDSLARV